MSSATNGYTAHLEEALERRGNPLTVDALLDILREASTSTSEALSAGERAFLLRPESGFTTGAVLPVDGGRSVLGPDPEST